ncbi:TonB-dependent siderophore receptor [Zavarzinia aquatilis]|uniref:TonB-dependent siderophore receptor n=1 Tax=Zavarzinia aquatilis TaxID=2211142 RepID=A0A317EHA6_9PROT|nr:TonB-dependent receptor [Zavarzinia aquatilis]PWR25460.1 TonB-dependent siderophore receptor [Zavarzinia aquatilis]
MTMTMMAKGSGARLRRLLASASILALLTGAATARAEQTTAGAAAGQTDGLYPFSIPAQALPRAIAAFSATTGIQVLYTERSAYEHMAPAVSGQLSANEALSRLLAGTGLTWRYTGANALTIEKLPESSGTEALDTVVVEGRVGNGSTEGTGSYAGSVSRSATGLSLSPRETPQTITVVTRQKIEDQGTDEIKDVLDQTVGITFQRAGAIGTDADEVYARGFPVSAYQVDGLNRSTLYGYDDSISDMAAFDRVEILRGANGLLTGKGDPSATINLIHKRPTDTFAAHATAEIGSWDHYRAEADVSGPLNEAGTIRARFVAAYQDEESFIARLSTDKQVFYGIVEADLTPATTVSLSVDYQEHNADSASRGGIPLVYADGTPTNLPRSTSSATDWAYHKNDSLSVQTAIEHRFDNDWTAEARLEHVSRSYDSLIGYGVGGSLQHDGSGMFIYSSRWASEPEQNTYALNLSGPYELLGRKHELMLGIAGFQAQEVGPNFKDWWSAGFVTIPDYFTWNGEAALFDTSSDGTFENAERQFGAYGATRLRPTDDLSIIVGARASNWKQGELRENGVFTPYAGIVFDLDETWSVYGSYTSIFLPQSNQRENGSYLDPETGTAYEGGLKAEFFDGQLYGTIAYFDITKDNFASALAGVMTPSGGQAYEAVDGAQSRGVEIELAGAILPGWQVGGGFSHTRVEGPDGKPLRPTVPENSFKLFTTYRLPEDIAPLTVGGNLRWQSDMTNTNFHYTQESYALLDLMGRWQINDHLSAAVNVNNVFDETYYASIGWMGYYGEPRNVTLTLRADW